MEEAAEWTNCLLEAVQIVAEHAAADLSSPPAQVDAAPATDQQESSDPVPQQGAGSNNAEPKKAGVVHKNPLQQALHVNPMLEQEQVAVQAVPTELAAVQAETLAAEAEAAAQAKIAEAEARVAAAEARAAEAQAQVKMEARVVAAEARAVEAEAQAELNARVAAAEARAAEAEAQAELAARSPPKSEAPVQSYAVAEVSDDSAEGAAGLGLDCPNSAGIGSAEPFYFEQKEQQQQQQQQQQHFSALDEYMKYDSGATTLVSFQMHQPIPQRPCKHPCTS